MAAVRLALARLLARVREPRGILLIELLLAGTLSLVVFGGAVTFFVVASNQATVTNKRVEALDRLRDGYERFRREGRQALSVTTPQSGPNLSIVELELWVGPDGTSAQAPHTVRWDCSTAGSSPGSRRCTREDLTAGTPAAVVIDHLADADPFVLQAMQAPATLPGLEVTFARPMPEADHPIVLHSTVTPRNCVRIAAQPGETVDFAEPICEGTT